MKREIKFRGLRTDNNEWVEGNLINWHEKLEPRIIWFKIEGESISESEQIETNFEVKRESVGQFTGLKDKNGIDIYEGDIVSHIDYKGYSSDKWEVVFYSGAFWIAGLPRKIRIYNIGDRLNAIEVIGNIHANPELLQQQ